MKKHLIAILIIVLILSLGGVGIWLFIRNRNIKPLYDANCEFILSEDTQALKTKIAQAEILYAEVVSGETRLATLHNIITKLDTFDSDLNSYLVVKKIKPSKTKSLSKSYSNLTKTRSTLLVEYDEYITRMSGNLNADGSAVEVLYDKLFNKTVSYIYKYNECFNKTSNYVFTKVSKVDTIKQELYSLYSLSVSNLLNNISSNNFTSTTLIKKLNNAINLSNGNIVINSSVAGGEFSETAFKFKSHFRNSNLTILINNFVTYCNETIDINTETSNEKLAIYYAKQLLEI